VNSTISTPFLFLKTAATSFLADSICVNIFGLFGKCMCIYCFDCSLVSRVTHKKKNFYCLLHCDWEIHCHLCGIAKKESKPKPFSALCVLPWAIWKPSFYKTYGCKVPCFVCVCVCVCQHFEQDHHTLSMADHFGLHYWTFVHPSLNILHHCRIISWPVLFSWLSSTGKSQWIL
jgi:hypothetical protein